MKKPLPNKNVVLLGVGHTNAHIVRMWQMKAVTGTQLTCVSDHSIATYSGMLPGVLSGQYPSERMEIDLSRLCASAGAELIVAEVNGVDWDKREILFSNRASMPFDVLSIGIGSVPSLKGVEIFGDNLVPIKPMQTFVPRLESKLSDWKKGQSPDPLRIVVVGGGVGGIEIMLCLPPTVRRVVGDVALDFKLIHGGQKIGSGLLDGTSEKIRVLMEERGIGLVLGKRVTRIEEVGVTLDNDGTLLCDIVLWAGSASAPPLLSELGLPVDEHGFLLTDSTLKTTANAPIFAVGDTGTIEHLPTAKAGVHAVRQGPILWKNIVRFLEKRPLLSYQPQKSFLKLINTGDGRAIAEYKGFSFHGKLWWWLKNAIDSMFVGRFQK